MMRGIILLGAMNARGRKAAATASELGAELGEV